MMSLVNSSQGDKIERIFVFWIFWQLFENKFWTTFYTVQFMQLLC
jgi:hypothetical protein